MIYSLVEKNHTETFTTQNNLVLEVTRLFLSKNNDFTKLKLIDTKLYFDNNLLLENITKYEISKVNTIFTIDVCVYNKICQIWKIES